MPLNWSTKFAVRRTWRRLTIDAHPFLAGLGSEFDERFLSAMLPLSLTTVPKLGRERKYGISRTSSVVQRSVLDAFWVRTPWWPIPLKSGTTLKSRTNVALYSGTTVEDDVFLGPSCVLTNVSNPRSQVVRRGVYEPTLLRRGATVGANATIVCGDHFGQILFCGRRCRGNKRCP